MSDEGNVVPIRTNPSYELPEKVNPAIPDQVWERLQQLGDVASQHLMRLLLDPRFPNFDLKDQMKVIDTVFNRVYGSTDGSVRKNLHVHVDPESKAGFNMMRELSEHATSSLPEMRPTDRVSTKITDEQPCDDAVLVDDPGDKPVGEGVTSSGD